MEIELNPEVKVVTERRLAKPKNDESEEKSRRSSVEGGGEAEEEEENGSEVKTEDDVDSERQRNESEASMDSSEQPAKRCVGYHGKTSVCVCVCVYFLKNSLKHITKKRLLKRCLIS